jgi:hypothetical protein
LLCSPLLFAENSSPVTLNSSETLFVVLTAINNCGFDEELATSDPLRRTIRSEVGNNLAASENAKGAADSVCSFYRDHQQSDPAQTMAQYVSLALYLNPAPALTLKVKESDVPPDVNGVLGLVPLLGKFYTQAGIHAIWQEHSAAYAELGSRYRDAFVSMISGTELYLRLPSNSYLDRTFTIDIEPMGAPSETNARNYGTAYYVVITPGTGHGLKMEQIRHAYLHYLLDPMVGSYSANLDKIEPLLDTVKLAPMDESFKADPVLLATECLIRSIEARTLADGKAPQTEQDRSVDDSMAQGYILTRYFYERLLDFEKDSIGFRSALSAMLVQIDVRKEQRRAGQIQFATSAQPELLHLAAPKEGKLLVTAEERLSAGDRATAEKLAKQALAEKTEDPGRAFFILAQAAGTMGEARDYFEQAIKTTSEPKVVAWSHIYLGRMLDLRDEQEGGAFRAQAIVHYQAAVKASDSLPEAKAAAEQGMQKPFAPPGDAHPEPAKPDDPKN